MRHIPKPSNYNLALLSEQISAAVPEVTGVVERDDSFVLYSRLGVEFTDAQVNKAVQVAQAHDPTELNQKKIENKQEIANSEFKSITLAKVNERIDAINNLAEMKVFMKKLVRYLVSGGLNHG